MSQTRPCVLLAVTGSIAAYKAAELARCFIRRGHRVVPMMTHGAKRFLGESTLSGLCGIKVASDPFAAAGELHLDVWRGVHAMVIAPATADAIARLAQGRADDLVSAAALCRRGPLFVAPAMHPVMWSHPAVARNVEWLANDGCVLLGPVEGEVASGDQGLGRMMEPEDICERVASALGREADLSGRSVVVSAGPTFEDLDPVRFLGNRSSGKMGYALAEAAAQRGASVELVSGPVALAPPSGVRTHRVRSALEMQAALAPLVHSADIVIMAAAVADFRAEAISKEKIKRGEGGLDLELVQNPDIIAGLSREHSPKRPILVAFAVETGSDAELAEAGRRKLEQKGVDLVVVNSASDGFEGDGNRVQLVSARGVEVEPRMSKSELAHRILDRALKGTA